MSQQYVPGQVMVLTAPQRNSLGIFGFAVSLIGLIVPTGVLSFLGFVLCLAAIGRAPRGFAAFGVVLGLIGTVFWMIVSLVAAAVALLGVVVMALGFAITQPEVVELTTDMVNVVIAAEEYEREHEERPGELAVLPLNPTMTLDPWGRSYRLVTDEADGELEVVSSGPDGMFETEDDIRSSRLDRVWEDALERFEERMVAFAERMERASSADGRSRGVSGSISRGDYVRAYECEAVAELWRERGVEGE